MERRGLAVIGALVAASFNLSAVAVSLAVPTFTATRFADLIRFEAEGVVSLQVRVYDLAETILWDSDVLLGDMVDWDRTDTFGERVANGLYVYHVQGWDAVGSPTLDKTGKVALLPGDQVELRSAPVPVPVRGDSAADRDEGTITQPMGLGDHPIYGSMRIGTTSGGYMLRVEGDVNGGQGVMVDNPNTGTSAYTFFTLMNDLNHALQLHVFGENYSSSSLADKARLRASGTDGLILATSDPAPIEFQIDDSTRMVLDDSGNVGVGTTSPSQELDVAGDINMTGFLYRNGTTLLHNDAANYNTFVGRNAGNQTMTGAENTGMGDSALSSLTSGNANTALGENALITNEDGSWNTALGDDSLFSNVSGNWNTGVGDNVLVANTLGDANTAVGRKALEDSANDNNTAIGCEALLDLTSGSNNTALGHAAGQYCTTGSHNVYISNGGTNESNTTRIGDANQTRTFISGIYGVAVAGGSQVVVDSNGQLGNAGISSREFKRDIADIGSTSELLYDLRPVSFFYREELDPVGVPQYGLIAEEVAEVAPELVLADEFGNPESVRYNLLAPLLVEELQRKDEEIRDLRSQIEALQGQVRDMLQRLDAIESVLSP